MVLVESHINRRLIAWAFVIGTSGLFGIVGPLLQHWYLNQATDYRSVDYFILEHLTLHFLFCIVSLSGFWLIFSNCRRIQDILLWIVVPNLLFGVTSIQMDHTHSNPEHSAVEYWNIYVLAIARIWGALLAIKLILCIPILKLGQRQKLSIKDFLIGAILVATIVGNLGGHQYDAFGFYYPGRSDHYDLLAYGSLAEFNTTYDGWLHGDLWQFLLDDQGIIKDRRIKELIAVFCVLATLFLPLLVTTQRNSLKKSITKSFFVTCTICLVYSILATAFFPTLPRLFTSEFLTGIWMVWLYVVAAIVISKDLHVALYPADSTTVSSPSDEDDPLA